MSVSAKSITVGCPLFLRTSSVSSPTTHGHVDRRCLLFVSCQPFCFSSLDSNTVTIVEDGTRGQSVPARQVACFGWGTPAETDSYLPRPRASPAHITHTTSTSTIRLEVAPIDHPFKIIYLLAFSPLGVHPMLFSIFSALVCPFLRVVIIFLPRFFLVRRGAAIPTVRTSSRRKTIMTPIGKVSGSFTVGVMSVCCFSPSSWTWLLQLKYPRPLLPSVSVRWIHMDASLA